MTDNCNRPLSRAARQLFRRDASHILLHYFGSSHNAAWRQSQISGVRDADKSGMKRQRIPLVDNPEDKLIDEEWFQLLTYAIDNNNNHQFCPLHPKHDMFLNDDQNSYVIQRRYRIGTKKFGGLSLPLLGRAARSLLWLEEREMYHQSTHATSSYNNDRSTFAANKRYMGNSVHLFQCGYCQKTFVSRYYLDRHMDLHHRHNLSDNDKASDNGGAEEARMICPADHTCDPLGGISACTEMMNQISPYWGRGTMLGNEYVDSNRESLFSSSLHSLLDHFHRDSSDPLESIDDDADDDDNEQPPIIENEMPQKYNRRVREGDLSAIVGEIRHRSSIRNKRLFKTLLVEKLKQQNPQQLVDDVQSDLSIDAYYDSNLQDDDMHQFTSMTCDNEEMERLFKVCQEMMTNCFGEDDSPNSIGQHVNLVHDLVEQICQPLHCHHRLHRMAGHTARHMVMWNNEWEEHHSYSLGLVGWLVILALVLFYACAFMLGVGSDGNWGSNLLPSYRSTRQKKKSS